MKATLPVIIISALSLSGCMSMLTYGEATKERTRTEYNPVHEDVIDQFGYPVFEGQRQPGVVLLGKNYAYLISKGIQQVEQITQLNAEYVEVLEPLLINKYSDNSVEIDLDFDYRKPSSYYTKQERHVLDTMCEEIYIPNKNVTYYKCRASLEGGMYQPIQHTATSNYRLKQGVKADIREVGSKHYKNYADLAVMPLSVAVDIVTLPLQLLWIGSALTAPFD